MTIVGTLLLPRPAPALEFPKYDKATRGNTTVIVMKQDRVPLVAIRVTIDLEAIPAPIRPTPAEALLYAHTIKYGSKNYPGERWLQTLENTGGELIENADERSITLATEVRSTDANGVLELLLDGVYYPELSAAKLNQERERLIAEVTGLADQPQLLADRALNAAYFGKNHPYSERITPEALRTAKSFRLESRCFRSYVIFVGDVLTDAGALARQAGERSPLSTMDAGVATHNMEPPPAVCATAKAGGLAAGAGLKSPRVILIDLPDATQTQVRLMVPGPTDLYSPLHLANVPFGGTFTSRLTRKLRTELGLTYGIYSRLEQRPLASTYEVSSFTKVASTGEFLKVLFAEFAKARTGGLTAEEIAKGKALMLGEGPMRWERYSGLAALLERNTLEGRPDDYPLAIITRAQGMDAKAANAALAAALPNKNYVLVLAGPAAKIKPIAAQYGAVEVWTKQQVIDPK